MTVNGRSAGLPRKLPEPDTYRLNGRRKLLNQDTEDSFIKVGILFSLP